MKDPRKLPTQDWKAKLRGDIPALEIGGDSLTVVNWVNGPSKSGVMHSCKTVKEHKKLWQW